MSPYTLFSSIRGLSVVGIDIRREDRTLLIVNSYRSFVGALNRINLGVLVADGYPVHLELLQVLGQAAPE